MARQTARHKESKKISRSKAKKKKMKTLRHVGYGIGAVLGFGFLTGGSWWLIDSGYVDNWSDSISESMYGLTADAGFSVRQIYIEGREKTSAALVKEIITVKQGDALLAVPVDEIREELEKLNTVKTASVERILPDVLKVVLNERQPVAVWQNGGRLHLVDIDGKVLRHDIDAKDSPLMVVAGKDAPQHIDDLFALLDKEPSMAKQVVSATWVGGRRWNLKLEGGARVLLPEIAPEEAWERLAEMQERDRILEKNLLSIDMRIEEKVFLKQAPPQTPNEEPAEET